MSKHRNSQDVCLDVRRSGGMRDTPCGCVPAGEIPTRKKCATVGHVYVKNVEIAKCAWYGPLHQQNQKQL